MIDFTHQAMRAGQAIAISLTSIFIAQTTWAQTLCRPALSASDIHSAAGSWTGTITASTDQCANDKGYFYLSFVRMKENAPDLYFLEQFVWRKGETIHIDLHLALDETVVEFHPGTAALCPCGDVMAAADQHRGSVHSK